MSPQKSRTVSYPGSWLAANFFCVSEKTNPYWENQSLSEKPILIGKTNPYRENQFLSGKQILIGKTNPYRENQSLLGKPIFIGKTNPYRENKSLSGKQILIGKTNRIRKTNNKHSILCVCLWAYGVVVSMFDFHSSDRGSNPGRGGKIS